MIEGTYCLAIMVFISLNVYLMEVYGSLMGGSKFGQRVAFHSLVSQTLPLRTHCPTVQDLVNAIGHVGQA